MKKIILILLLLISVNTLFAQSGYYKRLKVDDSLYAPLRINAGSYYLNGVLITFGGSAVDTSLLLHKYNGTIFNARLSDSVFRFGYNLDTTKTPKLSMNNVFYGFNDYRWKIGVDSIVASGYSYGLAQDLNVTAADSILLNSHTKLINKSLSIEGAVKTNITVLKGSSLSFKSGGNDTIGTVDDYDFWIETADTGRVYVDKLGGFHLRDTIPVRWNKGYGWVYVGGRRFIHNYWNSNYGLATNPQGRDSIIGTSTNLFMGLDAGNFTLAGAGKNLWEGNSNTSFGNFTLRSLTTGYQNVAFGYNSGSAITSGTNNFAIGTSALANVTTGIGNLALGNYAMVNAGSGTYQNTMIGTNTGYGVVGNSYYVNVGIGGNTLFSLTTGQRNVVIGNAGLYKLTTGHGNIFIGTQASNQFGAVTWGRTTTGSWNIVIGDTGKVSNTNGSIGLSNDTTANRHLIIGNAIYARDIYTDTVKAGIGIRDDSVTARWHIKAGSTQRHTAPLKFNSGSLLTTPEVGAVEFLTDDLYYTQTTDTKRNRVAINRSDTLSTYAGTVPVTMNGSLKKVVANQNCTLNATGGVAGSSIVFYFSNSSGADRTITFGTNFKTASTLVVGYATAGTDEATITFICLDGTTWVETARIGAF